MQKRFLLITIALVMILVFAGCGSSNESVQEQTEETTAAQDTETESTAKDAASGEKALVVYFSRTGEQHAVGEIEKGNTAIVADMIAEETGADQFEIVPEEDYPYTYDELTDIAKREQNENARPAFAGELPDLENYDTVFIGAPVWWGDWPMIMYTFFDKADLSGKKLIPFSTHEGRGLAGFDQSLAEAFPDAQVLEGLAVQGSDAQNAQDQVKETVQEWLPGLGF